MKTFLVQLIVIFASFSCFAAPTKYVGQFTGNGAGLTNLFSIGTDATNYTLAASNSVRLVAGLDATNHVNAVLQSATNYANGVTNSSIVRQTELTTASNVLNSAIVGGSGEANVNGEISVTNSTMFGLVYGKAGISNLVRSIAARYGLVGTNESGTNISLAIDPSIVPSQAQLTTVSNSAISGFQSGSNLSYTLAGNGTNQANANSVAASNLSYAIGTAATNYANSRAVALSNLSYSIGTDATNYTLAASNSVRLVAGLDATNHVNAVLQSATNYANGVTNSSIVRQTELTTASNVLNSAIVAATNSMSVTGWINFRQPATANLTNWSAAVTDAFVRGSGGVATNLTTYSASPGLTVVPLPGLNSNAFQVLNTNLQRVVFVETNGTFISSNAAHLGSLTNTGPATFASAITGYNGVTLNGGAFTGNATNLTNFDFKADAFVFAGDSFIGKVGLNAGTPYGSEMPTYLLKTSNYSHYLYSYNFGVGGYTTRDVSNIYSATISPTKPAAGVTTYFFLQTGENDTDGTFTNFWTNVVIRARSDGFKIVAFTARTNGTSGAQQQSRNTNNLMVRASSALWDYLVDYDALLTNSAVQLMANGHPSAAFNKNVADYISGAIVPANSRQWNEITPPAYATHDFLTINSNLDMLGGIAIRGSVLYSSGIGGQLGWDGSQVVLSSLSDGLTAGSAPVTIQALDTRFNKGSVTINNAGLGAGSGVLSYDGAELVITCTSDGTTAGSAPLYFQANLLHLNKGGVTIDGPLGSFNGNGIGLTNLTNFLTTDAFVFAGDSYAGELGLNGGSPYGREWPSLLIGTSTNFSRYLYTYNFGGGGYTMTDVSNTYATTIGLAKPAAGTTAYLFLQTGQNLEAAGGAFSNMWSNVVIRARTDGYKIVAFTVDTNQSVGVQQQARNTNNLYIRASSGLWDYMIDWDLLVTNPATQFDANAHPTPAFNQQVANYIDGAIPAAHSKAFNKIMPPRVVVTDLLTVRSNITASGIGITGPVLYSAGPGGQLGWDGINFVITSTSDGLNAGTAPTYIQASTLYLNKGGLAIKTGGSTTNAFAGGNIWTSYGLFTNLNALSTMSNLCTLNIGANVLTNAGDAVTVRWGGSFMNAAANTNEFQIVYGSTTVLDTGLQNSSNGAWFATLTIARSGSTAQHVEAQFDWGLGRTNINIETVETNGILTALALKGGARRVGAHTNNSTRAWYDPATR